MKPFEALKAAFKSRRGLISFTAMIVGIVILFITDQSGETKLTIATIAGMILAIFGGQNFCEVISLYMNGKMK